MGLGRFGNVKTGRVEKGVVLFCFCYLFRGFLSECVKSTITLRLHVPNGIK